MKPKYKVEFPDYDDTLPELEGFTDSSWSNDACPSLSKETSGGNTVTVFVDYKDPSLREHDEQEFRYVVIEFPANRTLLATNEWSDVVTFAEGIK